MVPIPSSEPKIVDELEAVGPAHHGHASHVFMKKRRASIFDLALTLDAQRNTHRVCIPCSTPNHPVSFERRAAYLHAALHHPHLLRGRPGDAEHDSSTDDESEPSCSLGQHALSQGQGSDEHVPVSSDAGDDSSSSAPSSLSTLDVSGVLTYPCRHAQSHCSSNSRVSQHGPFSSCIAAQSGSDDVYSEAVSSEDDALGGRSSGSDSPNSDGSGGPVPGGSPYDSGSDSDGDHIYRRYTCVATCTLLPSV